VRGVSGRGPGERAWWRRVSEHFGEGPDQGVALGAGKEGGGGGVLAILYIICFLHAQDSQINLGFLETYWTSGRLVIPLLTGTLTSNEFLKIKKKAPSI